MESTTENEIDLQELAIKGIRYFENHFYFITISTLIGIVLSVVAFFLLPKVYESRLIIMSDILTESYSKEVTNSLKNLIKEGNSSELALRLGIGASEADQITGLEILSVKKDKEAEKEAEKSIFIVTANIKSKEILPKLQEGIIQFLRNNEFVKIRVRQRREMYQSLIEKVTIEINSLDSLKKRLFHGIPVYGKSAEMMLVDPTNIYSKLIELNRDRIVYKNTLELADSIQLVEGFTVYQKPAEPKLSILLVAGFFGGFFFAIGFLVVTRLLRLANSKLR